MSNIIALKPPADNAEPKVAQVGTRMFRRGDVMSALNKLVFYARRNVQVAREEGRDADADIQLARLRAFDLVRDALHCIPEFENAQAVEGVVRRINEGTE